MSAEEIRMLAKDNINAGILCADGNIVAALLDYAAMVERCDNVLKANAKELKYRHKDADAALAYANYILRGDAGKEER